MAVVTKLRNKKYFMRFFSGVRYSVPNAWSLSINSLANTLANTLTNTLTTTLASDFFTRYPQHIGTYIDVQLDDKVIS